MARGSMSAMPDPALPAEESESPRRFRAKQRAVLFLAADGECENCGAALETGWHADHVDPWSLGGATDVINGQALCASCNLKKGNRTPMRLRPWQQAALNVITAGSKNDYLIEATPGAGKTVFGMTQAKRSLAEGTAKRVVVVVPSDSLRQQWADAAVGHGLSLMPVKDPADYEKRGYDGCVVTYQQLAAGAGSDLLRRTMKTPTIVLLDEIHHAGESKSWGDGLQNAVEHAAMRVALTGTPWRSDTTSRIPFVDYDDVTLEVKVDYSYGYGQAVADGVCRRIEFLAYDGEAKWHDLTENVNVEARLGADLSRDQVSATLDAVFDPQYTWMPALLREANATLSEMRQDIPDAGGLVIAKTRGYADAYATLLEEITGNRPAVAHGERQDPKGVIERFRNSKDPWLVAVKMVSEGVDIPRLAVGAYATNIDTPLFFRQVVGRFVRTRPDEDLNARLFIPAVPGLMERARTIEEELRHQLEIEKERAEREQSEREGNGQGALALRVTIGTSEAELAGSIMSGEEATTEEIEQCRTMAADLDLPERYSMHMLKKVREENVRKLALTVELPVAGPAPAPADEPVARHRYEKMLRDNLTDLVNRLGNLLASRSNGRLNRGDGAKRVNADLRKSFGNRRDMTIEELEDAKQVVERWIKNNEELMTHG